VAAPIENPHFIAQRSDSITYAKGASILRMMQVWLDSAHPTQKNPTYFMKRLQEYIHKYQYQNTRTSDLWSSLSGNTSLNNLASILKDWTDQKGYPLVIFNHKEILLTLIDFHPCFLLDYGQNSVKFYGFFAAISLSYMDFFFE
jgi:hypothetical protein